MTKKIEVSSCEECPYHEILNFESHCNVMGEKDISEPDKIPDWCPLEDY